jgi:poly(3-hydroxyalkanoate) synthetase
MDLDETHSMARWFAARGREAWTMSVRGTGESGRPNPAANGGRPITFDAYWRQDLLAAVEHVRTVSGSSDIDFVGHSMGGMMLYAYLSQGGQGIHAAATLGSPTRLDWGVGFERVALTFGKGLSTDGPALPSQLAARLVAPFQTLFDDDPVQRFFYNPESTLPTTWQRLVAFGVADTAAGTLRQLLPLLDDGKFTSVDGSIDFRAAMQSIRTPILVVAAKLDRVAPTPAVKDGFFALSGPKRWMLITRANGAHGEYGHMDLVIAEHADRDVFEPVLDFLNANETSTQEP